MKRSEIFFSVLLLPVDILMLLAGFALAYYLRDSFPLLTPDGLSSFTSRIKYNPTAVVELSFPHYLHYLNFIIPVMILIFAFTGMYAIRSDLTRSQQIGHTVIGVSVGEFFILLLFLLKKDFFIPRGTVLYSWLLCMAFVLVGRWLMRQFRKLLYRHHIGLIQVAVIGKNRTAHKVVEQLCENPNSAYSLQLHLDSLPLSEIRSELINQEIDELIIVSENYSNHDLIALRNLCLEEQIGFSFVPPLLTELQSVFDVRTMVGIPMVEVRPTPLDGWGRVSKRLFDVIFSFIILILLSPLLLIISIILKIVSPGPLIYKHRRIGKDKQPIDIWKFRSMKWEYCTGVGEGKGDVYFQKLLADHPDLAKEWEETQKLKNDPRVTWVGKFLRQSRLDELPQLVNVLTGTLSLVGPRPIIQEEVRRFGEKARILFSVKPGITGPWQISGGNDLPYEDRLALNAYYIEHWNLGMDFMILLKTIWHLLKPNSERGAY